MSRVSHLVTHRVAGGLRMHVRVACDGSGGPLPGRRRRVVVVRGAAWVLPLILGGTLSAGCAAFNKTFGQREAIVTFQQGTPDSVRLTVRAACSHVPQATPEPLPTDNKLSDYVNDVRYRIDKATDADLAQLENCLNKFRSVRGVETPQDQNS